MLRTCYYTVLFISILFTFCNGLERTRLNPNAENLNLLRSESGRDPISAQGFSALPQESQNNDGGKTGRVHDLVQFYNSQGKLSNQSLQPKQSSYSSVAAGSKSQIPANQLNNKNNPVIPTKPQTGAAGPSYDEFPGLGQSTAPQKHGPQIQVKQNTPTPTISTPGKLSTKPTFSNILGGKEPHSTSNVNTPGTIPPKSPVNPAAKPSFSAIVAGGSSRDSSTKGGRPSSPSSNPINSSGKPSSNAPSDSELQSLSEELLRKDSNNAAKLITVNYQEKTTSQSKEDKAPLPLFNISDSVYKISTVEKFLPLLDNYERDTLVNEYVTPQERNEENIFMDAIMQTQVIRHLMTFFKDKGYVTPDPRQQRDFIKQLWFNLYSRGKGKISSSGFEHVFVSELKNGEVSGLHNWLYFAQEETANKANYLGFLRHVQFNDKGAVLKLHFSQQNLDKPVDTMFVGTSPELEIALYSLCFITRADRDCPIKLGGKDINIVTHTFRYRSKNMIGSAYPQI